MQGNTLKAEMSVGSEKRRYLYSISQLFEIDIGQKDIKICGNAEVGGIFPPQILWGN